MNVRKVRASQNHRVQWSIYVLRVLFVTNDPYEPCILFFMFPLREKYTIRTMIMKARAGVRMRLNYIAIEVDYSSLVTQTWWVGKYVCP